MRGRLAAVVVAGLAVAAVAACGSSGGGTGDAVAAVIRGSVTAGPTCPVARSDDPACAASPMAGVVVLARDPAGRVVGRATTDRDGHYELAVRATGRVTVEGQPVRGLRTAPQPRAVDLTASGATVDLRYDTGIR